MIGTGLALLGSAALGLGGSLLKGKMDADASTKAADTQTAASLSALALQRQGLGLQQQGLDFTKKQYEQGRTDMMPWLTAGKRGLQQYQVELGIAPGKSAFRQQPGYQFQVSEGTKGVINNLAALGMKNSGSALKSLTRFRMGLADSTYNTYLDRLSGLSGAGANASSNSATLGQQASSAVNAGLGGMSNTLGGMGQTLQDAGASRASGYVGTANAWGGALTGGINTIANTLGRYSTGNYNFGGA